MSRKNASIEKKSLESLIWFLHASKNRILSHFAFFTIFFAGIKWFYSWPSFHNNWFPDPIEGRCSGTIRQSWNISLTFKSKLFVNFYEIIFFFEFFAKYYIKLLILLRISINWIEFLPYLSLKFIRYFEVAQRSSFHNKFLIRGRLAFIFGTYRARASGLRKANVKKKWFTQRYPYMRYPYMHMIHMIWLLWYDIKNTIFMQFYLWFRRPL